MKRSISTWRSYDSIARQYDDTWGDRFEEAARYIWTLIPHRAGDSVLDIGTGTGAVPRALDARLDELKVIGCDRSTEMLSVAKAQTSMLCSLAAEAEDLPFRQSIFDVVTASFVMSHLQDYKAGLIEAYRVLKPAGVFAMSSWASGTNPYSEAWDRLLTEAVSRERLQEGVDQVTPFAGYFEDGNNVSTALTEAGFADIQLHIVALKRCLFLEDYLAEREITSSAATPSTFWAPKSGPIWLRMHVKSSGKCMDPFFTAAATPSLRSDTKSEGIDSSNGQHAPLSPQPW